MNRYRISPIWVSTLCAAAAHGGARQPVLRILPPPTVPAEIRQLQSAVKRRPSAFLYRRLADRAATGGFHAIAAEAYEREAALHRENGDPNAAVAEELKAGRHRTDARLFVLDTRFSAPVPPRARLEPEYGTLLGAFIDRDDQLRTVVSDENSQTHRLPEEFEALTGKKHASVFWYLKFGRPFPSRWVARLHRQGIIPHIAWEPRDLSEVTDSAYLARFAAAVRASGGPVFLRFAGEMNGAWTPYHGDPERYRAAFKTVSTTIHRLAPNAAMIWCVNNAPDATIDSYYPGDDAVDWVGVNFYNVLYAYNNPGRPADTLHPADLLAPVYRRYAHRKPIAICEYAASQQSAVDGRQRPDYAARRMRDLYTSLPRLFPRVKLVDWFDCNNLRHAGPTRQLNNYSLTENPAVLAAYRRAISSEHFLSGAQDRASYRIRPILQNETLRGPQRLTGWVRAPVAGARAYLFVGEQFLREIEIPGDEEVEWAPSAGLRTAPLRLVVVDARGRLLGEQKLSVRLEPR